MRSARGDIKGKPLVLRVALPEAPGHAAILQQVAQSWAVLGVKVEHVAGNAPNPDLAIFETIAPADSATWFLNQFRCRPKAYCKPPVDAFMDQARKAPHDLNRPKDARHAEQNGKTGG